MSEPHQQTAKPPLKTRIEAFAINHAQVMISSLGRICRAPVASVMTISVIAIALALPAGFYLLLTNAQQLSAGWDGAARISLYLKTDISDAQIEALLKKLGSRPQVQKLRMIDKDEALEEFKSLSNFGGALDALDSNPLPAVIVITPVVDAQHPEEVKLLLAELRMIPEVDIAQLDLQWVKRLHSITQLVQRGLVVIAGMLGLAVVLVIGNTIRLDIQSRKVEIEVNKLIGATNAFIRRPFLYTGFWYGLLGGSVACILVGISSGMVRGPAQRLAGLYESQFALLSIDFLSIVTLISSAVLLGSLGSWMAVSRHLRDIEPG